MAKTNKHKAQGAPKKPVKESWWTPERVKAVISICVVLIIVAIGIGVYRYIDNKQDSVVGTWKTEFVSADTQEEMSIVFTFNADKTCSFVRNRSGEQEAEMSGQYSVDEDSRYLSLMLGDDYSNFSMYKYTCKKGTLTMVNVDNASETVYEKVTE